ncbi:MAG: UDP-glucose 6-dehydrogenase [Candidatus Curtissbacteria bacterium GW2011_GWA1_40_16]|uniref:UDP-glucose 6-dehydrogenase n=1 Tax=Candidatus Curtissbacteria bacterium GW2011_GWA1_40_16 TaxID=1618405 RepID=A0A0G0UMG1_9BACT|nr:MAG: UDP-glucose 6-dehydrogenase [Candidatus Curtissbacteria bacterium GW2011_GWA1_40_16]
MTITVIGAGYVGLVTASIFAELGNKVFCIDIDQEKVDRLNRGIVPFYEPSLAEYINRNAKEKRLQFTTSYSQSVPKSQVVFICVGTPPRQNGEADLSFLFSAVEETAKNLAGYTLITIKSTIPIGYEDDLEAAVKKYARAKYEFASSPEFLREGTAIEDSLHPDRIVIGTSSQKAQKILLELHAPLPGERIVCDLRSAQLIKYAANAFLATKISFSNALSCICERTGADVSKVVQGVGADKRIGHSYLYPGVGYGGSCLPKDVLAFIAQARNFDYDFELLRAVDAINTGQIANFINKIRVALNLTEKQGKNLNGVKIAILGLAFKPNTDDMRDAPSVKIVQAILDLGGKVTAFDPKANEIAKKVLPDIEYANDVYLALKDKDAMVVVTEWPEFVQMDLEKAKKLLKKPIIVDGRNIFDPKKVKELGFSYTGIGR